MKDLIKPLNSAEAEVIQKILAQEGIPAQVLSFHDTAYDGLFQVQKGWGVIRVPVNDYLRALNLVEAWRSASPADLPWDETPEGR
jgi:hypothetical protein